MQDEATYTIQRPAIGYCQICGCPLEDDERELCTRCKRREEKGGEDCS